MDFIPSQYQQKILDYFITNINKNLLVNALAGSGKSSTACLLTEHSKTLDIYIAFNSSVVAEFKNKIKNPKTKVMTIHSLAYSIMLYNVEQEKPVVKKAGFGTRGTNPSKVTLDNFKPYKILDDLITKEYGKYIPFTKRVFLKDSYVSLYNLCRLTLTNMSINTDVRNLIKDHTLFEYYGEEGYSAPPIEEITSTLKTLDAKSQDLFETERIIDFTDMIWITYNKLLSKEWSVPYWAMYTNIYVDECVLGISYVLLQNGKGINIKKLYKKVNAGEGPFYIKSFNTDKEKFEYKKVLNVKKKGIQEVFEVKTEGLNKLVATANHPILTQRGFVKLSDLKIGEDYLYLDKPEKQKSKYILNDDQLQLVLASSIGDGHLAKMSEFNTYRIIFTQGDAQYKYFQFKKEMLGCSFERKIKSGYTGKENINHTSSKTFILPLDRWELMKKVDERFFAIWYQDDGSINFHDSEKHGKMVANVRIACNNLSDSQAEFLQILIKDKLNLKTRLFKSKGYNCLSFNSKEARLFLKKIAPFMNEDCAYKNPFFNKENLYSWNSEFKSYGGNFVKSISPLSKEEVYDIEVEDNHNFVLWNNSSPSRHTGIVVHNCQDFSNIQLNFLKFIKRVNGRYIFIGDFHQAIYNFAGSNAQAFKQIPKMFAPVEEFDLPVCYRCAKSHLARVNREYNIPILPRDNAPEGFIKTIEKKDIVNYVQAGDMIISRKNKWVAPVILDLAKKGIPVYIEDKEMVTSIKKLIDSSKAKTVRGLRTSLKDIINSFNKKLRELILKDNQVGEENNEEAKLQAVTSTTAKIDNVNFVLEILDGYEENHSLNDTTQTFSSFVTHLLNTTPSPDCVRLCSIHKAKGLEAENVFVLNEAKINYDFRNSKEQNVQEKNLSYIATTRAKNGLYLVKETAEDTNKKVRKDI